MKNNIFFVEKNNYSSYKALAKLPLPHIITSGTRLSNYKIMQHVKTETKFSDLIYEDVRNHAPIKLSISL